jgi:hypothetical protein
MRLTILSVPDCPHVAVLAERLDQAIAGLTGLVGSLTVVVDQVVVQTADEAARAGLRGSPTLLIDGTDPFAEPGVVASLSCRLYRQPGGGIEGAPSVTQLRAALSRAGAAGAGLSPGCDDLALVATT